MKILFVSAFAPVPPNTGSRQRTKLLMDALGCIGRVDFCLHSAWPQPPATIEAIREEYNLVDYQFSEDPMGTWFFPVMLFSHPLAYHLAQNYASTRSFYSVRNRLAHAVHELCETEKYDLIVARYFRCASRSGVLEYNHTCIDIDDVDSEYFASSAAAPGVSGFKRKLYLKQAEQLRAFMARGLKNIDIAWVTKNEDLGKVAARRNRLLPNVVNAARAPAERPSTANSSKILFVGTLAWEPNESGLLHFVQHILGRIVEKKPEIRLQVISAECRAALAKLLASFPHVEFVGPVADLSPYYEQCLFSVVPIYCGAGSHIKVLESLYYGVTSVVTSFGHRGYESDLKSGECLLRADDDDAFVRHCLALIEQPALRTSLAERGMQVVKEKYTREAFYRNVADCVAELGIIAGSPAERIYKSP